jgi:hypothetical protein
MCAAARQMPMTLRAEKFLGANSGQAESNIQPDFIRLRDAIHRFSGHDGEHDQQGADDARERGLAHLARKKLEYGEFVS